MTISFRTARDEDLGELVALLADDRLGAGRESLAEPLPQAYRRAFAAIDADPNHLLLLIRDDDRIAGMLQLSFIPHLTHTGAWRGQIEGVRIARDHRGRGLGRKLIGHAVKMAADRGCRLVQLTTDRARPEAVDFYLACGFRHTHAGMKYPLEAAS